MFYRGFATIDMKVFNNRIVQTGCYVTKVVLTKKRGVPELNW